MLWLHNAHYSLFYLKQHVIMVGDLVWQVMSSKSEVSGLLLKAAKLDFLSWLTGKHIVVAVLGLVLQTQSVCFWLICTNRLQIL